MTLWSRLGPLDRLNIFREAPHRAKVMISEDEIARLEATAWATIERFHGKKFTDVAKQALTSAKAETAGDGEVAT